MKNSLTFAATATTLLLALLLSGCGSSGYGTSSSSSGAQTPASTAKSSPATSAGARYGAGAPAAAPSSAGASSGATPGAGAGALTVSVKRDKLGTVLAAGPKNLTVYMFEADHGAVSTCSGECAKVWPPVTLAANATASASGGAAAADVATITRTDGSKQVTYKGHPLYYYARDRDSGDAYGQGLKSFGAPWYVLAPSGSKIDRS